MDTPSYDVGDRVIARWAATETAQVEGSVPDSARGVVLGPDPDAPMLAELMTGLYRVRWADGFEDYYLPEQITPAP